MQLLKEYYEVKLTEERLNELREAHKEGKPLVLQGVVQRADAKNQNGRIYPFDVLSKEVDRYKNECVMKGIALGELDHREEPVIELKNASHVLEDLWWEGKDLKGKVRLLNTNAGKTAQQLVLDGINLGISSRAVGSVSKNEAEGTDVVGEDLNVICWDLVSQPSTVGAFLSENKHLDHFDPSKVLPPEIRIKQTLEELLKGK